jgi:hypothetical protein
MAQTEVGRLLRVLLIRLRAVSARSGDACMGQVLERLMSAFGGKADVTV